MSEATSAVVTFLFTDVEGSTQLLKLLGRDAYAKVITAHERLLRETFAAHRGQVIDTQGDALFAAFPSARHGLEAAAAGQLALVGHSWPEGVDIRVRMGLHTGEATTSDGRYHGVSVHRAARICAAAHGGQDDGSVKRIDGELNEARRLDPWAGSFERLFDLAPCASVASDGKHVSAALGAELSELDLNGNVVRRLLLDPPGNSSAGLNPCRSLEFAGGELWVGRFQGEIGRLDPDSGLFSPVFSPGDDLPAGFAVGAGFLWVLFNNLDLETGSQVTNVSRIGLNDGIERARIRVGTSVGRPGTETIVAADEGVWIIDTAGLALVRIDPKTDTASAKLPLRHFACCVSLGHDRVWVTLQTPGPDAAGG